ncbi:hypothetical protein DYB31_006068 [Aphanomyces astaci]|uniref:Uncharacterized protein n=1 Tax=Aphanomyces astaci TaxID=112090 RepID=A0A397EYX3_APHAT|nr:hypothetical protein DYB31_006068 [Aphanomyces astaci]
MLDQLPSWIAMYFVVAFSSSLDVAAIEMALHKPLDHNAELQTIGWSNVISGLTGGFTGSYIFSSTIFSMKSGVDSRLTGVLVFALELVLVTFIAIDLTMEWMVHYANLWFTFVIVDVWNLEVGIVLGTIDARQASASFRDKHDFHLRTLLPLLLLVPMTSTRKFRCDDLFRFNNVNLDVLTETAEGKGENWHGHVTAVTVAPEFRRLGLAKNLMDYLENVSVELYVYLRVSIFVALPRDKDKKSIIPLPYPVMPDSLMD